MGALAGKNLHILSPLPLSSGSAMCLVQFSLFPAPLSNYFLQLHTTLSLQSDSMWAIPGDSLNSSVRQVGRHDYPQFIEEASEGISLTQVTQLSRDRAATRTLSTFFSLHCVTSRRKQDQCLGYVCVLPLTGVFKLIKERTPIPVITFPFTKLQAGTPKVLQGEVTAF